MVTVVLRGARELEGAIEAPPSKSYTIRAVIAASLSLDESRILRPLVCGDTLAALRGCSLMGAKVILDSSGLRVSGASELRAPASPIDCGESATTIRFLTPLAALARGRTILTGGRGLRRRPIGPLVKALQELGVKCSSSKGFPPVLVSGEGIRGGHASIVGNVSSQFISALLFACPLAREETVIDITTSLESRPYVELTLKIVESHGVEIHKSNNLRRFKIPPKQGYKASDHVVPGDFSSSAFIMAAAAVTNSRIAITNLRQGIPDERIISILKDMGIKTWLRRGVVRIQGGVLEAIEIDARDIPDLVPPCAALACFSRGETRIFNAERLRIKESNRLKALTLELKKMGADIAETEGGLVIKGPCKLHGAVINTHDDHRIAMACAVAGLGAEGATVIRNAECINKSYPNFFKDLKKLGANILVR